MNNSVNKQTFDIKTINRTLGFGLLLSFPFFFPSFLYSEQNRLQKIDIELQNEINKENEKYNKSSLVDYERLSRYKKELHSITNDGGINILIDLFTSSNQESRKKEAESFLNSLDAQGKTPLMYAIQFNDSDTVEECETPCFYQKSRSVSFCLL